MESYIIEFSGEISEKYRKRLFRATMKMLWILVLIIFVVLCGPIIVIGVVFDLLFYAIIFILVILILCATAPIALIKTIPYAKILPVRIIIENGEIAALNAEHISKYSIKTGGIDFLNVDGYFITDIKSIFDVIKVFDHGEWYVISFKSRPVIIDYICQKNLLIKGTIEEFEKLFEGKIVRSKHRHKET